MKKETKINILRYIIIIGIFIIVTLPLYKTETKNLDAYNERYLECNFSIAEDHSILLTSYCEEELNILHSNAEKHIKIIDSLYLIIIPAISLVLAINSKSKMNRFFYIGLLITSLITLNLLNKPYYESHIRVKIMSPKYNSVEYNI